MPDTPGGNKDKQIHERRFAAAGKLIVKQGEAGNSAFLIQSGRVQVYAEHAGKRVELAELGPGQIFGEMSLVVHADRSANVEALEDTTLIVITRKMLDQKLKNSDPTVRALVPMLLQRIQEANRAVLNKKETFADTTDAVEAVFSGLYGTLSPQQKRTMDRSVRPRLDAFLEALMQFEKLYGQEQE